MEATGFYEIVKSVVTGVSSNLLPPPSGIYLLWRWRQQVSTILHSETINNFEI
jgi:hypothetical protein